MKKRLLLVSPEKWNPGNGQKRKYGVYLEKKIKEANIEKNIRIEDGVWRRRRNDELLRLYSRRIWNIK